MMRALGFKVVFITALLITVMAITSLIILAIPAHAKTNTQAQSKDPPNIGYVKYTLILYNNTLKPGNIPNTENCLGPWGVTYDSRNGYIYVTCEYSNTVSVINPATNIAITTIPVGSKPMGITYDPNNGYIYVANSGSNTVSVINPATNTVIATIPVGENPVDIIYDPNNGYIYVTNTNSSTVSVINPVNNTVIATITLPAGSNPLGITYDLSNGYLYVADSGSNTISVINPVTNTVISTISVNGSPRYITYDPNNGYLYVTTKSLNSYYVSVINPINSTVIATIMIGSGFIITGITGITYVPSNGYIYVAFSEELIGSRSGLAFIAVINPSNDTIITTIPVMLEPMSIAYDPNNGYIYVTNTGSNTISVINPINNTVIATISLASEPQEIAYDPNNGYLYVTDPMSNAIFAINDKTNTVTNAIRVSALVITYVPSNGYLYGIGIPAALVPWDFIFAINPATNAIINMNMLVLSMPLGDIAYDPGNGYIYVTNESSISVINPMSNSIVTTIPVGFTVETVRIVYDANNGYLYVTFDNFSEYSIYSIYGGVAVINPTSNTVIGIIELGNGTEPIGIAYDPSNGYIYVADSGSDTVSVINPVSNTVIATIPVGPRPWGIVYDPSNGYIYVTDSGSDTVTVINPATNTVIGNITVGLYPQGIVYDPSNGYLYVANSGSGTVSVIATTNETVEYSVPCAINPSIIYYFDNSSASASFYINFTCAELDLSMGTGPMFGNLSTPGVYIPNDQSYFNHVVSGPYFISTVIDGWSVLGVTYMAVPTYGNGTVVNSTYVLQKTFIIASNGGQLIALILYRNLAPVSLDLNQYWSHIHKGVDGLSFSIWPPSYSPYAPPNPLWVQEALDIHGNTTLYINGQYQGSLTSFGLWQVLPTGPITLINNQSNWTISIVPIDDLSTTPQIQLVTNSFSIDGTNIDNSWMNIQQGEVVLAPNQYAQYVYSIGINTQPPNQAQVQQILPQLINLALTSIQVPITYTVTFIEEGLPSGASWSVTVNGTTETSTTNEITFTLSPGTYVYSVSTSAAGYAPVNPTGTFTVSGNETFTILFTQVKPTVLTSTIAINYFNVSIYPLSNSYPAYWVGSYNESGPQLVTFVPSDELVIIKYRGVLYGPNSTGIPYASVGVYIDNMLVGVNETLPDGTFYGELELEFPYGFHTVEFVFNGSNEYSPSSYEVAIIAYKDSGFHLFINSYGFSNWPFSSREELRVVKYIVSRLPPPWNNDPALYAVFLGLLPKLALGGHCFGMAASSAQYYVMPSVKPETIDTYQMSRNDVNVVNYIDWYQIMQLVVAPYLEPASSNAVSSSLSEIESLINNGIPAVLDFQYNYNGELISHAVTVMGYANVGNVTYLIVYDCNYPGELVPYVVYENSITVILPTNGTNIIIPSIGGTVERLAVINPEEIPQPFSINGLEDLLNALRHIYIYDNMTAISVDVPISIEVSSNGYILLKIVNNTLVNDDIPNSYIYLGNFTDVILLPTNNSYSVRIIGHANTNVNVSVIYANASKLVVNEFNNITVEKGSVLLLPNIKSNTMNIVINGSIYAQVQASSTEFDPEQVLDQLGQNSVIVNVFNGTGEPASTMPGVVYGILVNNSTMQQVAMAYMNINSQLVFSNIPPGTYILYVYHYPNMGLNKTEYWGNLTINVISGYNEVYNFNRDMPWIESVSTIQSGSETTIRVVIYNPQITGIYGIVTVYVSSQESPLNAQVLTQPAVLSPGTNIVNFIYSPSQPGTYYVYVVLQARVRQPLGQPVVTDQYGWAQLIQVTMIPSAANTTSSTLPVVNMLNETTLSIIIIITAVVIALIILLTAIRRKPAKLTRT